MVLLLASLDGLIAKVGKALCGPGVNHEDVITHQRLYFDK